jgi:anti-sigma regulatory factor (Ser/Thr protein kinase)
MQLTFTREDFPMIPAPVPAAVSARSAHDRRTGQAPWPLQTELELAALPSAVPCARGHVRSVALEWGLADLADTAELLASEMVTNAIQASGKLRTAETPVVRIRVTSDRESLTICVWDGSDEMPVRQDAGPDAISGRGLLLVESLSHDWGTYRAAKGKVVWVSL